MGKIDLEIFEDKFLKKNTAQYELSILLGVDSLCYAVSDSSRQVLGLRKYSYARPSSDFRSLHDALRDIALEDVLLRKPFARVRLAVFHPFVSLVPTRLYNDQEKKAYLEKLVHLESADRLFADELPFAKAMAVYPLGAPLVQEIQVLFPQAALCHASASLARSLASSYSGEGAKRIFINLRDGLVQVFAYEKEELLLLNTYPFLESADLVYYIMLVCQQLSWKPEEIPLFCSGLLLEDSAIFRNLQRFFPLLQFSALPAGSYSFGPRFEREFRRHWFIDLWSI